MVERKRSRLRGMAVFIATTWLLSFIILNHSLPIASLLLLAMRDNARKRDMLLPNTIHMFRIYSYDTCPWIDSRSFGIKRNETRLQVLVLYNNDFTYEACNLY